MNLGQAIVSHILLTGDIDAYLDRGLNKRWLEDPEQGSEAVFGPSTGNWFKAYSYLIQRAEEYGKIPSEPVFKETFDPDNACRIVNRDESADELIALAEVRIKRAVADFMFDLVEDAHATGDLAGMEDALTDGLEILRNGVAEQGVITEMANDDFDPIASYEKELKPGIPIGIQRIDDEYYGMQPSWLVTVVGRQKAKKSWFLFNMALQAWRAGKNVRVYSVELDNEEAWQRVYSMECNIAPSKWLVPTEKRAEFGMTRSEQDALEKFRAELAESANRFVITQVDWGTTPKTVIKDIRKNPTDVVLFDGAYELQDDSGRSSGTDWSAQDEVARTLKRLALRTGVTVVTTTQSQEKQQGSKKRPGIKLSSVQAGSAFNRYSDLMIGLDYEDEGQSDEVYLTNMLSRRNRIPEVILTWEFRDGCSVDSRPNEGGYEGTNDLVSQFMQKLDDDNPLAGTSARKRTKAREDEEPERDPEPEDDQPRRRRTTTRRARGNDS